MTKKKAPGGTRGPKTKYDRQTPITVAWLARDGKTNDEIAAALGIVRSTLQEWIKEHPELSDAIKRSKECVRFEVEDSLVKRAKGYDYEKTEIEVQKVGGKEVKKKKVTTMHVPPDPACAIFYLKTQWKDKYGEITLDFEKNKAEINALFDSMKEASPVATST